MSHVDEGALHAYLDGALDEYPAAEARHIREHLERCAECAGRLAEERRVRDDAAAMLGLAAPAVEMPSFEELRAYVQATRPQRPPAALRMYRMGWAASVVLALGVGWMLRGGQLPSVTTPNLENMPGALQDVAAPADPNQVMEGERLAREIGSQRDAGDAVDFADAGAGASSDGGAVGETVTRDQFVSGRGDIAENITADAAAAVARQAASAPSEPPTAGVPGVEVALLAEPEEGVLRKAQAEAVADEEVVASEVSAQLGGGVAGVPTDAVAALPARVPDLDSVLDDTRGGADPAGAPEEQLAERRRAEALEIAPAPAARGALAQGRRSNEDAPESDQDDVASLGVPGLEVVYIEALGGTTPGGVHVLQSYGDGQFVDVYRIPGDVDPAALLPVSNGRTEVRRQLEDGEWVILRATLTVDELAELLSRFDPEG